ncbi:hypothetical protein [Cognatiyoonia sp.]|uniref:hypothetical protein n=1 Tax=Cognatiyoonia sp. TaxID=2211652 RepID=UPI003F69B67A
MRYLKCLGLIAVLASCGAQSDPLRPTANFGLSVGSDGVQPSAQIGATNGPVSVSVGL